MLWWSDCSATMYCGCDVLPYCNAVMYCHIELPCCISTLYCLPIVKLLVGAGANIEANLDIAARQLYVLPQCTAYRL
jgi:hypothetical protein